MGFWKALKMACKATAFTARVAVTGTCVAGHLAKSTVRGTLGTLQTAGEALDKASKKDWDGLEQLAGEKFDHVCNAFDAKLRMAGELGNEAAACLEDKSRPFLTRQNARRIAGVISLGGLAAGGLAASDLLDGDADLDTDVHSFHGAADDDGAYDGPVIYERGSLSLSVENGVFNGGSEDLETLTAMGEVKGTEHIDSDDYARDIAARDSFLRAHGFDSVPEGYEVHHIVPLCEGGADEPDNMILVTEEDHDSITAAHARFYGWRRG